MKTIKLDNVEISEEAFYKKAVELGLVKPKSKVWVPADGEECWALYDDGGTISGTFYKHYQKEYDRGLIFKTREAAEYADWQRLAKMRVIRKLRELEDELVDWSDNKQIKYTIHYFYPDKKFSKDASSLIRFHDADLYTTSESAISWVIENMKEDLKLMFGVE